MSDADIVGEGSIVSVGVSDGDSNALGEADEGKGDADAAGMIGVSLLAPFPLPCIHNTVIPARMTDAAEVPTTRAMGARCLNSGLTI